MMTYSYNFYYNYFHYHHFLNFHSYLAHDSSVSIVTRLKFEQLSNWFRFLVGVEYFSPCSHILGATPASYPVGARGS
jgi:hypothetical protein